MNANVPGASSGRRDVERDNSRGRGVTVRVRKVSGKCPTINKNIWVTCSTCQVHGNENSRALGRRSEGEVRPSSGRLRSYGESRPPDSDRADLNRAVS
jgi:predicted RNA-binding Zn-ribbon protein involved in translation (DUF1610 family)